MRLRFLGRKPYQETWDAMKAFTEDRDESTIDECWIVEHPPVFTLGQAGKPEHILQTSDIPIVKTDRGGQVTYHGPGQIMGYCLFDLKRQKIGVKQLVTQIEQSVIDLVTDFSVVGERQEGAPGIYVKGRKISSIGLRIRKGCSYHGVAINLNMDLSPFLQINPCGYPGMKLVNLQEFSNEPQGFETVAGLWASKLAHRFGFEIKRV